LPSGALTLAHHNPTVKILSVTPLFNSMLAFSSLPSLKQKWPENFFSGHLNPD